MKNDYIIASINNPDFTAEDFKNVAGYTLKDTLMLKEEDYLNNLFITSNPLFLDSSGIFRKEKFSEFYKKVLGDFESFSNEDFADNYQYSPFDTRRKGKNKVLPFGLTFFNNPNPTMLTIGVEGPNVLGERTLSDREIAQREKIFDTKSGKFLDYSPNDLSLFHHPFKWLLSLALDPLVLAIYDENGTHLDPITGKQVKHVKGQYKLNNNGLPYYERLNGRSLVGRDLLSATDILTIEGDLINKYDFLDSDDTEKSIGGTIMKTVAAVAPLFIPYINAEYSQYVGYYGTYLMLRELAKTTPMLYAMGTALFNDKPDHYLSNTIAAYANKITTSTSDYAKLKMFSFENFGNLISDVALQWEQQLAVIRNFNKLNNATNKRIEAAKIKSLSEYESEATKLIQEAKLGKISTARVKELTGAANEKELKAIISNNEWELTSYGRVAQERNLQAIEDYIKNRTRLGLDLSLAYMALISNTDVYSSALQYGASKKEAAALALGSTAGMFSVDKYLGLGEMFFQVPAERQVFRNSIMTKANKMLSWLNSQAKEANNPGKYFKIGIDAAKQTVKGFREAAANRELPLIGKAIGEGLEEVSEELVTDMVKSVGELAADFGWISGPTDLGAWNQMFERYTMSLLGGTIGGGIFGLKMLGIQNQNGAKELELLVRQNKTSDLRRELKYLYEKGQLGRTDLAAEYEKVGNKEDGEKVFLTPDEKHISLNEYVYRMMSNAIDQLETIINEEHLTQTEDDLFKQLVLKDDRYLRLKSYLQGKSYLTGYQERYQDLVEGIVRNKVELNSLKDSKTDLELVKAENLRKSLAEKELERDRFLSGELSLEYLRKLDFLMNPILTKGFLNLTIEDFARAVTGADYASLDLGARIQVNKLYTVYLKTGLVKEDATKAFKSFMDLSNKMGQPLMNLIEQVRPSYNFWETNVLELEDLKKAAAWDWDLKIEGETQEEYDNRDTKMEGEDDAEFLLRLSKRQDIITQHNENIYNYLQSALLAGTLIDGTTKRRLNLILQKTEQQIKKNLLRLLGIKDPDIGQEIMSGTNPADILPKLEKQKAIEFRDAIWKSLLTNNFGFTTDLMKDEDTGEVEEGLFYPALFGFNGEEETDYLKVMSEALTRLMDKLGLTTFNISSLYSALGTTPEQVKLEFYNIYNSIIKEIVDLDTINGYTQYPMFSSAGFVEATNHPIADLLIKYGEGLQAIDPSLSEEERKKSISDLEQQFTLPDIRQNAIDILVSKKLLEWKEKGIEREAEAIQNALENNATLKLIKDIKHNSVLRSPAEDIMGLLTKYLGGENEDILRMLLDLGSRWEELRDEGEFEMTSIEKEKLLKAKEIIEMAKSIIAAMYKESYLGDAMPYNKAINEFVKAHKETQQNWEDLPVIDRHIGDSLYHSLDLYSQEIDEWIAVANRGTDNKVRSIKDAKAAYDGVIHSLLYSTLGADHWLLNGYSGDNDSAALVTMYRNALKAIKNGDRTLESIYDELLSRFNLDNVLSQITSEISPGLSTALFTDYDKFFHLVAYLAVNKAEYLKAERDFRKDNPNVAYLATLEPAMLYTYALKNNPEAIYKAIDLLVSKAKEKGLNIPSFYGLICTGIGGAGKTDVVARFAQFIGASTTTWLSGPTESLLNGLLEIAPKGIIKSRDNLMQQITNGVDLTTNTEKGVGIDKRLTLIVPNVSDKLNTANAPKLMLVDEATHYSNLQLQVISLWARKGGVTLTMLGDENLRGNIIKIKKFGGDEIINNIAREILIGLRTPRLAVTLRTRNLWKTRNLSGIVHLLDPLRNAAGEDDTERKKTELLSALDNDYYLDYYENETDIHGDKIVKTIEEIDFNKLKDKKVAYIGTNTEFIQGKLGNNVEFFPTLLDVQGKEIDYVIADNILDKFNYNDAFDLLEGMQSLYTAISRSKIGGFIIDGLGAFTRIHNRRQDYTTESVNLSEDIITLLNDARNAEIEEHLKSIPEEEPEEEPKKEEEQEKKIKGVTVKDLRKKVRDYENPEEEFNGEYRAYSNIKTLGGVDREDKTYLFDILGPGHITNWYANGKRKDIGIFKNSGLLASNPQEKASLVYDLYCLQSIFTFNKFDLDASGNEYLSIEEFNKLPDRVRALFDNDPGEFRNIKYYAVAEDYNPDEHSLIGNTTAKKDEISFMKKDGKDKVITIQARIPSKSGVVYTITLGAVANPSTWLAYVQNKEVPTDEIEKKAFKKWYDGQLNAINQYKLDLDDLIENGEQEIDKPTFSSQTDLISIGEAMPLADFDNESSEWDKITKNFSVSDVHVIVKDLQDINPALSKDLLGKPVIFVSADPTLNPDRLREIWESLQRHRDTHNPVVRMIVLDNNGISFSSLYRQVFEDIYSNKIETNEGREFDFNIPYETEPLAIRSFVGMWNFRANLVRFNKKVLSFALSKGWSIEQLDEKVKIYNDLYKRASKEVLDNEEGVLSDALFEKWLTENPDVEGVEDTLAIRTFNQKDLSTLRLFRIGYSTSGAYIGRLYGVDKSLYNDADKANGVYILPSLAVQYEGVIKNYFEALINPVFKDTIKDLPQDKKIDLIDEKWYDLMLSNRKIRFGTEDAEIIEATVPSGDDLHYFSYAIIKIPRNLRWKALKGKDAFLKTYNRPPEPGKPRPYRVTIKINGLDHICDYTNIDSPFTFDGKEGILKSSNTPRQGLLGEIKVLWEQDSGNTLERYVDTRMDSFLSIMMHGIVALKEYNKFNDKDLLHATDAPYPYGMFSDPVLAPKKYGEENYAARVLTHRALFTTNMIPGSPIFSFKLKKEVKVLKENLGAARNIVSEEDRKIIDIIDKINSIAGVTLLEGINSIPLGSNNKEQYIQTVINSYNYKMLNNKNLFDPSKIILNLGEQTLADKYNNIKDFSELIILPGQPLLVKISDSYYTLEVKGSDIIMEIKKTDSPDPDMTLGNGTKVYTMQNLKDYILDLANKRLPEEATAITNLMNTVIYKRGTGGRTGNSNTPVDKATYNPGKIKKTIVDKAKNKLDDNITDEILNYIDEWFECP